MPKGFTEDNRPILTKDEFMEFMLVPRGYEKINGKWVLSYPEMNTAVIQKTAVNNIPKPASKVVKPTKSESIIPAKKVIAVTNGAFSKDVIIAQVSNFLTENDYKFTADKACFMVACGNENYEFKVTRKTAAFAFLDYFEGVKDFGKQKFINQLQQMTFCNVGVIDNKGIVGFTNGKDYFAITITKKRK